MKTLRTQRIWFVIGALFFWMLSILSCSSNATLLDVHGFSNLVLHKDTLWFGAGYRLYQVDLNQQIATLVYDTKDFVISFVQIDEKNLYFGGYQTPNSRDGAIWSLDLDNESIVWKQEFKGNWFSWGGIVIPLLIDKEVVIVGTRTALHGIDKIDGDIRWKINVTWFGTDRDSLVPILANGQLFYRVDEVGGNGSNSNQEIVVAEPSSGKTLKTISVPGTPESVPAVYGNYMFVKDSQSYIRDNEGNIQYSGELRLNCIDLNSGKVIWTYQVNGGSESSPIGLYKGLVLDVFRNQLFAIDAQLGALRWQSPEFEAAARNPQVIEELDIIALEIPSSNKVVFVDSTNGELQEKEFASVLSSPVFIGRDMIYATTNALILVDIATGNTVWSIPVDSQYQIPADD